VNYFERLLRRALLRPRAGGPAVFSDPFENVEEWPLSPLESPPLSRAIAAAPATPAAEPVRPELLPEVPPAIAMAPTVADPETTRHAPAVPVLALPAVGAEREHAVAPAPLPVPLEPAIPAPLPLGLERADEFMRVLGIAVPGTAASAHFEPPLPAPPAPAALAPEEEQAPVPAPQVQIVMPPASTPPPLLSAEASTAEAAAVARAELSARDGGREAARPAQTIVERRQVVVVEKAVAQGEGAVGGGGSPRFGLGQL
jgi:hypothetical protein